jgi:hypothetical protein
MGEDNLLGSDLTTIQWSRHLNGGNEARGHGLVEVVVVAIDMDAVVELVQTLAGLTLKPLLKL